ncbi:MAG TPA: HAD family hydrolase [Pyrinomonadaceae bacterium]|nr:HAD family hydrolase [Pyrinomonadaceae bacterium]
MARKLLEGTSAVIFDAGNTIALPDWIRISRITEQITGQRFDEKELQERISAILSEADNDPDFLKRLAEKLITVGWHYRRLYNDLGIIEQQLEELIAALNSEHQKRHLWTKLNDDAIQVFEELKRLGKKLAVISNSEDGQVKALLRQMGVDKYFDLYIDSFEIGYAKPDPRIFLHTINELKVLPHETVYIGDMYMQDVLGAQRAGLKAILYDPLELRIEPDVIRISSLRELISQ